MIELYWWILTRPTKTCWSKRNVHNSIFSDDFPLIIINVLRNLQASQYCGNQSWFVTRKALTFLLPFLHKGTSHERTRQIYECHLPDITECTLNCFLIPGLGVSGASATRWQTSWQQFQMFLVNLTYKNGKNCNPLERFENPKNL